MPGRGLGAASWSSIEKMEQARWVRLAKEHADDESVPGFVVGQVAISGECTQAQAAQLARLAADRGWKIPVIGHKTNNRRRAKH